MVGELMTNKYCFPYTEYCLTMAEWSIYWQAAGVIASIVFGSFGLYKIYHELKRLNEQRKKDMADKEIASALKRTEFFLAQHRRLFDDSELYSILCLIDSDHSDLALDENWDKKRKLLTFFEEIALLVNSGQINKDVAIYMFGYYVRCAIYGVNFCVGIDPSREHWRLLYEFLNEVEMSIENADNGYQSLTL